MIEIFWKVFEIFINLLQGIMCAYFVGGCLDYKCSKRSSIIPILICITSITAAITICNYLSFYEGFAIFIYSFVLYIFEMVFMKGSALNKLFVAVVPVNAMAVGSIFSTNLVSLIINEPIYIFLSQNTYLRLITIGISNTVLFSILYIIKRVTTKKNLKLREAEWFLLSFDLILSVIAYMFLYYSIFCSNSILANFYNAICVVVIIVINISTYFLLANFSNRYAIQLENDLLRQQVEYQTDAIIETKKQYEEMQKARHDLNNMMGVIRTLNKEGKVDAIDNYISERFNTQISLKKLISTGNSFIDAVINTKLSEATDKKIDVRVSTICELREEYNIDICNLLGNLFDNAIRAASECEEKIIILDIRREPNGISITMKNSIKESVLSANPNLKSDKISKKDHGYGIKIIKDIAMRYQGFADFYEENNFFCCNVLLYF